MRTLRFRSKTRRSIRLLFAWILCALGGALHPANGVTVWIDTDPSIGSPFREVDDAFALILALHSPELKIAGVSTSYGNASLPTTTRIANDLIDRFGPPIPVHPGANSPRDLGRSTSATEALRRALGNERLTYLALGPLTNLATFQRLHPALARRIERVVVVGGQTPNVPLAFGPNGFLRIHDANVFKDPTAMAVVLQSRLPLTLAPVETSSQLRLNAADLKSLRSGKAGEFLYRKTRVWIWFWQSIVRMDGGPLFDALAVLAVARPDLVKTERRYASMNEKGDLIAQKKETPESRGVASCIALHPGAKEVVRKRLAKP
ncbi:MAG: nucleoside hydrolase [Limisphaerales bacterium]